MHNKFTSHGKGSAGKAIDYLLAELDSKGEPRAEVAVLRGDPHMVAAVADGLDYQWKYTSGVIAWAPEDAPTDQEIQQVLDDWERLAFAGLEPERRCWTAVLHRDDNGGVHVHTITARVDLETGKSFNPAPPGHRRHFDAFRDYWNHSAGWARPDDPARMRVVEPGPREAHRPGNKTEITQYITELAAAGLVTTAADVRQAVAQLGEITRSGADYISVKPEGASRAIRLKGGMFADDWTADAQLDREAAAAAARAAGRGGAIDKRAAAAARSDFEAAVQRRAEYNRARYQPRHQRADPEPERPELRDQNRVRSAAADAERGPEYGGAVVADRKSVV